MFQDTATFGPGETNETSLTSDGGNDIFVAKYNADGTLAWAVKAGGKSYERSIAVSTLDDGSALDTGSIEGTAVFGAGEADETSLVPDGIVDLIVAKYNPNGSLAWVVRAGGSNEDISSGTAVSTLNDGSALVTGSFEGMTTLGQGEANETTLTAAGRDAFVAKYNADGTLAWADRAGGVSFDFSHGISTLDDGSALITGTFQDTAAFGQGETNEVTLTSDGEYDIFVAKYNP